MNQRKSREKQRGNTPRNPSTRNIKDRSASRTRNQDNRNRRQRSASVPTFEERSSNRVTGKARSLSVSAKRKLTSDRKPWYDGGFPALRIADKKIREQRERSVAQKVSEEQSTRRKQTRGRSLSRGRSKSRDLIHFDGKQVSYYRSNSVGNTSRASSRGDGAFTPRINQQRTINLAYTGEETMSRSGSSLSQPRSRRNSIVLKKVESVLPHMRENYTINRLQAAVYQQVQKTYGVSATDIRQKQFYERLAKIQLEHYKMRYMKLREKDRAALDEKFKQFQSLSSQIDKYETESAKRYMSYDNNSGLIDAKFNQVASQGLLADTMNFHRQQKRDMRLLRTLGNPRSDNRSKHYSSPKYSYNTTKLERSSKHPLHRELHRRKPSQSTDSLEMMELIKEAEQLLALCDDESAYEALAKPVYHVKRKEEYIGNSSYRNNTNLSQRRQPVRALKPIRSTSISSSERNYHHQTVLQARQRLYMESRNRLINKGLSETNRTTYGGYARQRSRAIVK